MTAGIDAGRAPAGGPAAGEVPAQGPAAGSGEPVILVEQLRKTYGTTVAVDGVSLEVRKGEIFGLLGSNGAGKTTTVECLEGLRRPDAGVVRVLGEDPLALPARLGARVGGRALR